MIKCYPLLESEWKSLTTFNTALAAFSSLGTGFGFVALGVLIDHAMKSSSSPEEKKMAFVLIALCGIVSLAFFFFAGVAFFVRRSMWANVQESVISKSAYEVK